MSLDSTARSLFVGIVSGSTLFFSSPCCLGLENLEEANNTLDSNGIIFLQDQGSPFEVTHVTNVSDDEESSEEEDDDSPEAIEKDRDNDSQLQYREDESSSQEDLENQEEKVPVSNEIETEEVREEESPGASQESDLVESDQKLEPPKVSRKKSQSETKTLKKLVYMLQYGSLIDSINLLESMVRSYPYDPDYQNLLRAARSLRHADIWYQYQRRLQLPPPQAKPKTIYKMIKMKRNEEPINELKQASWFHLIKGKNRLINTTN